MAAENIPDEFDRVLSTVIDAEWKFNDSLNMDDGLNIEGEKFTEVYNKAVEGIMKIFFGPADVGENILCSICSKFNYKMQDADQHPFRKHRERLRK